MCLYHWRFKKLLMDLLHHGLIWKPMKFSTILKILVKKYSLATEILAQTTYKVPLSITSESLVTHITFVGFLSCVYSDNLSQETETGRPALRNKTINVDD
jgi:hypothetical protein